jgi:hypothetical protein
MHQDIGIFVSAHGRREARYAADAIFDEVVGNGSSFDYGEHRSVHSAKSKAGQKLIQTLHGYTRAEFGYNIGEVRKAISNGLSDDDLFAHGMFRHAAYCAGAYEGPGVYLYSKYGSGIRTDADLQHELSRERGDENLWLVIFDVHY